MKNVKKSNEQRDPAIENLLQLLGEPKKNEDAVKYLADSVKALGACEVKVLVNASNAGITARDLAGDTQKSDLDIGGIWVLARIPPSPSGQVVGVDVASGQDETVYCWGDGSLVIDAGMTGLYDVI